MTAATAAIAAVRSGQRRWRRGWQRPRLLDIEVRHRRVRLRELDDCFFDLIPSAPDALASGRHRSDDRSGRDSRSWIRRVSGRRRACCVLSASQYRWQP